MNDLITREQATKLFYELMGNVTAKDIIGWIIGGLTILVAVCLPLIVIRIQTNTESIIADRNELKEKLYRFSLLVESVYANIAGAMKEDGTIDRQSLRDKMENLAIIADQLKIYDSLNFCGEFAEDINKLRTETINNVMVFFKYLFDNKVLNMRSSSIYYIGQQL